MKVVGWGGGALAWGFQPRVGCGGSAQALVNCCLLPGLPGSLFLPSACSWRQQVHHAHLPPRARRWVCYKHREHTILCACFLPKLVCLSHAAFERVNLHGAAPFSHHDAGDPWASQDCSGSPNCPYGIKVSASALQVDTILLA